MNCHKYDFAVDGTCATCSCVCVSLLIRIMKLTWLKFIRFRADVYDPISRHQFKIPFDVEQPLTQDITIAFSDCWIEERFQFRNTLSFRLCCGRYDSLGRKMRGKKFDDSQRIHSATTVDDLIMGNCPERCSDIDHCVEATIQMEHGGRTFVERVNEIHIGFECSGNGLRIMTDRNSRQAITFWLVSLNHASTGETAFKTESNHRLTSGSLWPVIGLNASYSHSAPRPDPAIVQQPVVAFIKRFFCHFSA